ncbi:thialysine N-epsilon-acetyltransferase-like, partial [Hyla sarda]|uniref:thialysine N-epsilon-acetyltransferase-like n=1 Tax=Hyla sarda TaxID=327740 RepID=UPI0024C2AEF5
YRPYAVDFLFSYSTAHILIYITPHRVPPGVPFAGYALFANSYSSWTGRTLHLEDLYVSPTFRGRGLGRRLMKKVAQEGVRSGCSQIHLSVLKWNSPAISLYRSLGAQNLTEEPGYQVMSFQEEALRNMAEEEEP